MAAVPAAAHHTLQSSADQGQTWIHEPARGAIYTCMSSMTQQAYRSPGSAIRGSRRQRNVAPMGAFRQPPMIPIPARQSTTPLGARCGRRKWFYLTPRAGVPLHVSRVRATEVPIFAL